MQREKFTFAECYSSVTSITPVTIKPVKMHSQRLPINSLFTSVVFISLKFTCCYYVPFSLPTRHACGGTRPAFYPLWKQFPVRVAVVVLVKCPSRECDQTVFYKLFLSRCLGDAHPVSVQ